LFSYSYRLWLAECFSCSTIPVHPQPN
jgi:hypothetical protein